MLCNAPFLGLTIDPSGSIVLCCATNDRNYLKTNINDIDSLTDFFLGPEYQQVRDIITKEGIKGLPQCKSCWKAINGYWEEVNNYNSKNDPSDPLTIKYLEVTTSNVCNQTCVTCSSYFSSKWRKLEKQFNRNSFPSFYLNDSAINKILEVLPNLEYIQIKGGEPFADRNNLKILRELAKVNPTCEVIITSNFQMLSDEWLDVLKLLPNIKAGASIDGVGELYDWIRGGNFEDTVSNMELFYEKTGIKVMVNSCISIYNIFNIQDIHDYFKDKDYAGEILFNNVVEYPYHLSPKLLPQHIITKATCVQRVLYTEKGNNLKKLDSWVNSKSKEEIESLKKQFTLHTEQMNKVRESDIFVIHPELYDIFK